ncbi:MAG: DUF4864 domain-containing protein [Synechococcales bacterium]|nr:DUF4864 domain-containing protein [Synechococcales bacterium]
MNLQECDRQAIRAVVEAQLNALQRDDANLAFSFASPDIQAMFRTPENFLQMVRTSYEPVYRPRSVIFETIGDLQGTPTQPVLLLSPSGIPVRALYLMEQQRDRRWKINGCYLVPVESQFV